MSETRPDYARSKSTFSESCMTGVSICFFSLCVDVPSPRSRLYTIHQAKRPRLSALQSQTLSATSFVTDIAAIAGESDVDISEVRKSLTKVYVQDKCLLGWDIARDLTLPPIPSVVSDTPSIDL